MRGIPPWLFFWHSLPPPTSPPYPTPPTLPTPFFIFTHLPNPPHPHTFLSHVAEGCLGACIRALTARVYLEGGRWAPGALPLPKRLSQCPRLPPQLLRTHWGGQGEYNAKKIL